MTRLSLILSIALAWCLPSLLAAPAPRPADAPTLESVLKKMNDVAATFRSAQADFEWDTYEKVIDEVDDVQTGTIYYRKSGGGIEMMASVKKAGSTLAALKPEPKFVLLSGGKIRMYLPKPDQVTEFDLGKNLESYVVLGFGGSGQDLQKAFEVTFDGAETLNGTATAKLHLVPKSEKARNTYSEITLWIDLDRGISVQQKFVQPEGDYRLAKYSSIRMGEKISDDVFKLKTTGKTQTVAPRG